MIKQNKLRKFKVGDEAWAYSSRSIRHGIITAVYDDSNLVRFKADRAKTPETWGEQQLKSLDEMSK